AGPKLYEACRPLAPIQPGQAVITPAFNLPNRHVIHCLGPVYGIDTPSETLLADCYRNALQLAEDHHLQSIAFPAISTGIFGYPLTEATRIALHTVLDEANSLDTVNHVRFVLHSASDYRYFARLLEDITALRQDYTPLPLFTDLYELTMMQAYLAEGMQEQAVFTLSVRSLPKERNFLLAAGLGTVLDYLENLRFTDSDINYLATIPAFTDDFLEYLRHFRFTGNLYALPEGTPFFVDEPILEVEAPLPQAQLVETFIMNQVHLQTMLATKAQRVVEAANGRPVVDFGARRIHGIDAAVKGARAFYIGGVNATSNVLAGRQYGISVAGTIAHAYIQAHPTEADAFRTFTRLYPKTMLVVDTYDTLKGVQNVIDLARERGEDFGVTAVRLDSGDLLALSMEARQLLDQAGLKQVQIFASGGLDEYKIDRLVSAGAPIDGFGVGTAMGVSDDVPHLDIGYKLVQYAGKGRLKLAAAKTVLAGRKQVFRVSDQGEDKFDVIARADEKLEGRPLLKPVVRGGIRLHNAEISLASSQAYAKEQINRLPVPLRSLTRAEAPYPVKLSPTLQEYQERVTDELSGE
ncbi:MAG: nicotinate phosphoribosyltransferase, partial [Anaerolineaceae bacterium]